MKAMPSRHFRSGPGVSRLAREEADMDRTVTGHIPLSLDGRVSGPGGERDLGWTVRHAVTGEARAQLLAVTGPASTVLLDGPVTDRKSTRLNSSHVEISYA